MVRKPDEAAPAPLSPVWAEEMRIYEHLGPWYTCDNSEIEERLNQSLSLLLVLPLPLGFTQPQEN